MVGSPSGPTRYDAKNVALACIAMEKVTYDAVDLCQSVIDPTATSPGRTSDRAKTALGLKGVPQQGTGGGPMDPTKGTDRPGPSSGASSPTGGVSQAPASPVSLAPVVKPEQGASVVRAENGPINTNPRTTTTTKPEGGAQVLPKSSDEEFGSSSLLIFVPTALMWRLA